MRDKEVNYLAVIISFILMVILIFTGCLLGIIKMY